MAERRCDNCDFSRRAGPDINCWERPPEPLFLYRDLETGRLRVVPIMRPTWPDYRCRRWEEMHSDHPDHPDRVPTEPMPTATHQGSERPQ